MNHNPPKVPIVPQPTETTCGPTCLQAVYNYWGYEKPLNEIIKEVPSLEEGGTLTAYLGQHALKAGFQVKIYTYNLRVFDPSWFFPKRISYKIMMEKLKKREEERKERKLKLACKAYQKFLELGGHMRMRDLSPQLIRSYLKKGIPILTGLSSTFLYQVQRILQDPEHKFPYDDTLGDPDGHFVVLESYDPENRTITIADPYPNNPYAVNLRYTISSERVINSILLGVLTYDANLLIIEKKPETS